MMRARDGFNGMYSSTDRAVIRLRSSGVQARMGTLIAGGAGVDQGIGGEGEGVSTADAEVIGFGVGTCKGGTN